MINLFYVFIFSFLKDHQHLPDPTRQYVEWCLENCNHIKAGKISLQSNAIRNSIRISDSKRLSLIFIYLFQFFDEILLPLLKLRPWRDWVRLFADFSSWMVEQKLWMYIHVIQLKMSWTSWLTKLAFKALKDGPYTNLWEKARLIFNSMLIYTT